MALNLDTAEGLADLAKRERIEGKRQRRAVASMRQRARLMFADGIPIEDIAKALNTDPCRVRDAIETSKRLPASNREPDLQLKRVPLFTSVGAVRRMIDPPPAYATIRRMLFRANIKVLALSRGLRVIPTHELTAFLNRCTETTAPPTTKDRMRMRAAAEDAREAKALQEAANEIARIRDKAKALIAPAPSGPESNELGGSGIRDF